MSPSDRAARCPSCGARENQEQLGPLGYEPFIVYHCRSCGKIYVRLDDDRRDRESAKGT
ncbi:MAG TPA: hypothetical protein VHC19_19545 [Pirellulales bacterium]|nr:hypothetical protein [Pirellulales bacterium]